MVFERAKEVKGVHDNRPPSKQVEHVVDEAVNDDELVKDDNCIFLKEMNLDQILLWRKNLFNHKMRV